MKHCSNSRSLIHPTRHSARRGDSIQVQHPSLLVPALDDVPTNITALLQLMVVMENEQFRMEDAQDEGRRKEEERRKEEVKQRRDEEVTQFERLVANLAAHLIATQPPTRAQTIYAPVTPVDSCNCMIHPQGVHANLNFPRT